MEDEANLDALAELEATRELPSILSRLDGLVGELDQERQEVEKAAFTEFWDGDSNVATVRQEIPPRVRDRYLTHETVVREGEAAVKAGMLGPKQFEEMKAKAAEARDTAVFRELGFIERNLDIVDGRYGEKPLPQPAPEVLAEVQTGFSGFDVKTGSQHLREGERALQMVRNESLSPKERARWDQLLELLYEPTAQRMASSPPRHSRHLAPAFQRLQRAIETYLDIRRGGPKARVAEGFIRDARQQFDWATREARGGWDDLVISTGSPLFKWADERGTEK